MSKITDERAARLEIDAQLVDEMIKAFNLGAAAGRAEGLAEGMERIEALLNVINEIRGYNAEGAKHIDAWKALAAACDLVMAARMEENEAYDKAEDNHIHDTWVLGKAEHSAEDLAEWRAEWAAADTRLLEAETVLREARAVVRDLGK
jgi:hypothetical protein